MVAKCATALDVNVVCISYYGCPIPDWSLTFKIGDPCCLFSHLSAAVDRRIVMAINEHPSVPNMEPCSLVQECLSSPNGGRFREDESVMGALAGEGSRPVVYARLRHPSSLARGDAEALISYCLHRGLPHPSMEPPSSYTQQQRQAAPTTAPGYGACEFDAGGLSAAPARSKAGRKWWKLYADDSTGVKVLKVVGYLVAGAVVVAAACAAAMAVCFCAALASMPSEEYVVVRRW